MAWASEESTASLEEIAVEKFRRMVCHTGTLEKQAVMARAFWPPGSLPESARNFSTVQLCAELLTKVEPDNLLERLHNGPLAPEVFMMQRLSFQGSMWLGVGLKQGSPQQRFQFSVCAASLFNMRKVDYRAIVIEPCCREVGAASFACTPISTPRKRLPCSTTWLDLAEDLRELADLVQNAAQGHFMEDQAQLMAWAHNKARAPELPPRRHSDGGCEPAAGTRGTPQPQRQSSSCSAMRAAMAGAWSRLWAKPGTQRAAETREEQLAPVVPRGPDGQQTPARCSPPPAAKKPGRTLRTSCTTPVEEAAARRPSVRGASDVGARGISYAWAHEGCPQAMPAASSVAELPGAAWQGTPAPSRPPSCKTRSVMPALPESEQRPRQCGNTH